MKLTQPTPDGHFRPESSFRTEIEEYREEARRGPRRDLLTSFRLWIIDSTARFNVWLENRRRR